MMRKLEVSFATDGGGEQWKGEDMKRKAKGLSLGFVWAYRLKRHAEGDKRHAEGNKLRAEGSKYWAEGDKLRAEGNKLRAEGDKLWAEAVIAVHGNVTMEWKSSAHCVLGTGEEFTESALAAGGACSPDCARELAQAEERRD
jgi:hypothetical protein